VVNFVAKLLAQCLYDRLYPVFTELLAIEQSGFRGYHRGTDPNGTLRAVQQAAIRAGKKCFFCFIDLEKAFDQVPRELVRRALAHYGVPDSLCEVFWSLYSGHKFRVKSGDAVSQPRATSTGLKQGDLLSPIIFNITLQYVLETCDLGEGIKIKTTPLTTKEATPNTEASLHALLYADDIGTAAESLRDMKFQLQNLARGFREHGLRINFGKTKFMITNPDRNSPKPI